MLRLLALIFLIPYTCLLTAQSNNTLRGKILFLSSGKTPAIGVEISGLVEQSEQANSVYSTDAGAYQLSFPKAREGYAVDLSIGDRDASNTQLELVNEKEVTACRIPAKRTDEFDIIVAQKGSRDLVAQKYYKIIKTSADQALAKANQEIEDLLGAKKRDHQKISELFAKLDQLQKQTDSIDLYREAFRIASINKDNASERVLTYIRLLDEGKSLQEAREALSINKAANDLQKGLDLFRSAIEELTTRAQASATLFDYPDAILCYDTLIAFSERLGLDPLMRADHYGELAGYLQNNGQYPAALQALQQALVLQKNNLPAVNLHIATSLETIAHVHLLLGDYDQALSEQLKGQAIREELLQPDHIKLASSYNNLGNIYRELGQYDQALHFHLKSLRLREEAHPIDSLTLASSYHNYSAILMTLGRYEESLDLQQKAVAISESLLPVNSPELANRYSSLSGSYERLEQYDQALLYQEKALEIREKTLHPLHPGMAVSFGNLGELYSRVNRHDQAIAFLQKAIDLQLSMDSLHPKLAVSYGKIGASYFDAGQVEQALRYQKKAIELKTSTLGPGHAELIPTYSNIGKSYLTLGQYEEALDNQQQAFLIASQTLAPNHPYLGIIHSNLASVLVKMDSLAQAREHMESCIDIFSQSLPANHSYHHQALNSFLQIVDKEGQQLFRKGKYAAALACFDIIINRADSNYQDLWQIHSLSGLSQLHLGDEIAADDNFQKAEQLALAHQYIHRNWALSYALRKQFDQATIHLDKAFDMGYQEADWLETDPQLDGFRRKKGFKFFSRQLKKKDEAP